jgi:hypothetical protein
MKPSDPAINWRMNGFNLGRYGLGMNRPPDGKSVSGISDLPEVTSTAIGHLSLTIRASRNPFREPGI